MLIPIRCGTCGNTLASKYRRYFHNLNKLLEQKDAESQIVTFDKPNTDIYHKIMTDVGLKRYCCKRHFLGQENIMYKLR